MNLAGIDLGTTFSVIAHLDATGTARTISNSDGDPLTPSAVYLDGSYALVGKAAKEAASLHPDKVAMFFKRDMGKRSYAQPVDGRTLRPETLSAIVLRKLKQDAERKIGPIGQAVITVPAFFDDTRRKATEDAGRIAGLDVLEIINEPTAAALAYSLADRLRGAGGDVSALPSERTTALVYDLGGGTFDVTVVELEGSRFDTRATDGEVLLGGKDWDDKIVDYVCRKFAEEHGVNPKDDPQRRGALLAAAESTKVLLSKLPSAPLECSYQDRTLKLVLTRDDLENLTANLLTRTEIVTDLVVREQAKLAWGEVDRVLLVGGSTRMPMVKKMLRRVTGQEPDDSLDPDQVVAHGAAIFASVYAAQADRAEMNVDEGWRKMLQDVVVNDVNAHSLGVQALDARRNLNVSSKLVPKNTQLPYAQSRVFRTSKANARTVRVKVLEGEADEAAANILIGECVITDLPPDLPERSPIQVRLSYGTNGRVNVMALDMTGGKLAQAEIHRQGGLTEEDIRREAAFVEGLEIQ